MHKTKKHIISLLMVMVMMVAFCIPTMAVEPLSSTIIGSPHDGMIVVSESEIDAPQTRDLHPAFYSGQVYGYNATTNQIALVGEATWSWGAQQPDYLSVAKEDYWWLAANGFNQWYYKYTWDSRDCTYLKIYDARGDVLIESAALPNTIYEISFFSQGASTVDLRMDWIVGGMRINNIGMGGVDVNFN